MYAVHADPAMQAPGPGLSPVLPIKSRDDWVGEGRQVERAGRISSHCFLEGRTSHCVSRAGKQEMVFPLRWIHPGTMNGVSGQKQMRTPSDTMICVFKCVLHSRFRWARKTCKQLHLCGIHCQAHMRRHGASSAHAHMREHRSSRVGTFGCRCPYIVALFPGSWPASSCRDPQAI